ncbi:hypothetical protein CSOJ01_01106 [Colletotrichum sojae]|uniref:Uncharacterized protein n=1 Tax=Colletotrichum sojae TaxID=2175907 RepID=A0A8H6JUN8_9PEZI|nr:hypothetical protein CSOJ01_01106 [Colletotrichum sojae]
MSLLATDVLFGELLRLVVSFWRKNDELDRPLRGTDERSSFAIVVALEEKPLSLDPERHDGRVKQARKEREERKQGLRRDTRYGHLTRASQLTGGKRETVEQSGGRVREHSTEFLLHGKETQCLRKVQRQQQQQQHPPLPQSPETECTKGWQRRGQAGAKQDLSSKIGGRSRRHWPKRLPNVGRTPGVVRFAQWVSPMSPTVRLAPAAVAVASKAGTYPRLTGEGRCRRRARTRRATAEGIRGMALGPKTASCHWSWPGPPDLELADTVEALQEGPGTHVRWRCRLAWKSPPASTSPHIISIHNITEPGQAPGGIPHSADGSTLTEREIRIDGGRQNDGNVGVGRFVTVETETPVTGQLAKLTDHTDVKADGKALKLSLSPVLPCLQLRPLPLSLSSSRGEEQLAALAMKQFTRHLHHSPHDTTHTNAIIASASDAGGIRVRQGSRTPTPFCLTETAGAAAGAEALSAFQRLGLEWDLGTWTA